MKKVDPHNGLIFLSASLGLLNTIGLPAQASGKDGPSRPNVIIIMTDDQGYGEMSCHGNPILSTPNIDRLHDISIRFTNFHASAMSAPTRGQLMTGIDAARNGTTNVSSGRALLNPDCHTMADAFSENGYKTAMFGKWHLGDNYPYRPEDRGFDETIWFPSSHISSVPDSWGNDYFDDIYIHNGEKERYKGYCTDIFFDNAIDWISGCSDRGDPFFVYLPTNTPHHPLNAPDENLISVREAVQASPFSDMEPKLKGRLTSYLAMIQNIDSNIGGLVNFLTEKGLLDNTILIFTTDNGSTFGDQYYNVGMRGRKAELYEGGHRVPLFISWPGGNFRAPSDEDGLTEIQDIFPTLVELCRLKIPGSLRFDGISLARTLMGKAKIDDSRMIVINYSRMPAGFEYPSPSAPSYVSREGSAVLWKSWRFLEETELYDLKSDPGQKNNIIGQSPVVAGKMSRHLAKWWKGVSETANKLNYVVIGSDTGNQVMLTSCEWVDVFLDQQAQVRKGIKKNSYWNILVQEAGDYEFELRRWPRELDLSLTDGRDGGVCLPIASARFFIDDGRYKGAKKPMTFEGQTEKLQREDKYARFRVHLEKGPARLHTWFDDEDSNTICGAYYVYVTRLNTVISD
jgi:arylsulfatase